MSSPAISTRRPIIVICLGGTGNHVARELKELQRRFNSRTIFLLVLDTDSKTFKDEEFAPLPALDSKEKVLLYSPETPFAEVAENLKKYPEIDHFTQGNMVDRIRELDQQNGAGQRRIIGRVAFYTFFSTVTEELKQVFQECESIHHRLSQTATLKPGDVLDPVVYVISSTCGGQGAGCFLDLAVLIRVMTAETFPRLSLKGILTLPSVYKGSETYVRENEPQMEANAHAFMTELDMLMHGSESSKSILRFRFPEPFKCQFQAPIPLLHTCYLIGGSGRHGRFNRIDDIYQQIARQIWLEAASPIGSENESARSNLNTVHGDLLTNDGFGRRYSSFGNFEMVCDVNQLLEIASHQAAKTFLSHILSGGKQ